MARLADYFAVIGFDHEKAREGISQGIILQRFPEKDWSDTPFIDGIEWFCQPQGWRLSSERQEPRFFVSILTDVDANPHYCSCLSFFETVSVTPTKPVDEEEDTIEGEHVTALTTTQHTTRSLNQHHTIKYAPKCLVLVSRLDYIETFRNCLGIIYSVYLESMQVPLETLIGNILGCIQVPPPGGPQVRFSIGAGDRQALQPPRSPTLPVTHTAVYLLFKQLGIRNVLVLFCAIMTENKILFQSRSYARLTDACRALTALMYPFKYSHVHIPLLPSYLVEVLSTPTPFVIGVHSSDVPELMDVIVADLDGGAIFVPDSVSLPLLPEPLLSHTTNCLSLILQSELSYADFAFPPLVTSRHSHPDLIDKEIRAVFLRTFAQLLQGYRTCLTIIRTVPKPVMTFHKAAFLGERGLIDCDFTTRLLDCMFFTAFVSERGPAWRACDQWDELYCDMNELLRKEEQNPKTVLQHIQELSQDLYTNENPNPQPYVQKIIKPPEGAFARIHQPAFPKINSDQVQTLINDGLAKHNLKSRLQSLKPLPPRIVPMGPQITNINDTRQIVSNSARRLEVLRSCINCIFENKISDARKTFPAVLRALTSRAERLALCTELGQHVVGNKAMLEHQQFDLVVRLMNCALQDGLATNEFGVAAALLPLSTAFCRKLCTGVIQFAYTCIQEHPVWQNQQFWEAAYYQDVQRDIKALYLESSSSNKYSHMGMSYHPSSPRGPNDLTNNNNTKDWTNRIPHSQEPTALEIAAEQMRLWGTIDPEKQKERISSEESTLYSQAIHYANRMVFLLVPLDVGGGKSHHPRDKHHIDDERMSNSITNRSSVAESDSGDAESGFEETDPAGEAGATVIKTVSRFVDKVCTEGGVSSEHIRSLHQMIPGVVHIHIETLDAVYRESKRLPPIQKPKILTPNMLPGEEPMIEGLRAYLLPDGREEGTGGSSGGPPLLPTEGAIFLTNYRIIFKGTPLDPFACEQVVTRAFPITSLTKEKRITQHYLSHLDQWMQEGHQLRSSTFQLIRVAFDEEVTPENIECFRKLLHKLRHPEHILHHFAFCGQQMVPQTALNESKGKNASLKGIAKKAFVKTARKAGFKQKTSSKRQKYVLNTGGVSNNASKYMTSPGRMAIPFPENEDELSIDDFEVDIPSGVTPHVTDAKTLERLVERSYVRDWTRLGLAGGGGGGGRGGGGGSIGSGGKSNKEQFRISTVNTHYMMCRSYPALLVMPSAISDESVRKIYRCYRHHRLPVVTWRHSKNKSLLIRGSGYHGKGVIGMLKATHPSSTGVSNSETTSSMEQERYLSILVSLTPLSLLRQSCGWGMSDSSLSINSLLLAAEDNTLTTPEISRRSNPFSKPMATMGVFPRSSGGKASSSGGSKTFSRWNSLKDRRNSAANLPPSGGGSGVPREGSGSNLRSPHNPARLSGESDSGSEAVQTFHRAVLYILGEKAQMKGMKPDSILKTDYIPVEYADIRHTKAAFKKLMRACVPSSPNAEPDQSFLRQIESSQWLQQIQNIMQLSGAVVDLLDVQGSSVMLCLEDGWDITCQLSSLSQLCLDPYYRTMEGFRILVEKEWLAFGHRFSHRSNLNVHSPASGFTPTFLQFLDCVHQILTQFPLAFEFNDFYLRFLAYHSVSCRFRTFLLDCELERVEFGFTAVEDKRGSLTSHHKGVDTGSDDDMVYPGGRLSGATHGTLGQQNLGQSVFDFIEKHHARSPMFFNFLYTPDVENLVLRPQAHLPNLDIWSFYLTEELRHGPPYDLEIIQLDNQAEEEAEAADGTSNKSSRKVITSGYNNIDQSMPDAFSYVLEEIHRLESELGLLPQKWKMLWDKLELPTTDSLTRHSSFSTQMVRWHGRLLHKRSTLEILMRGKLTNSNTGPGISTNENTGSTVAPSPHVYSHPHRFERHNPTTPTYCDFCTNLLWIPVKTTMRCCDCGYSCHERCAEFVPNNCTKYKNVQDGGTLTNQTIARSHDSSSVNSSVTAKQNQQYYDQFSSNVAENRTHEGYLYKRGALLKGWKQRWFVLDSIKHQLRYYDAMEDSHCKGYIDLAEVMSVTQAQPTPGPPKKTDDKSFFDLRTNRRTYNFCANDASNAQEWIEKIQACLQ